MTPNLLNNIIFYSCTFTIVCCGIYMLFTDKLVRLAVAFLTILLSIAILFVLQNAELLSIAHILTYIGGVLILIIFGIMITQDYENLENRKNIKSFFQEIVLFFIITFFLIYIYFQTDWELPFIGTKYYIISDTDLLLEYQKIGLTLLTDHILSFELLAIILLSTLVGASFIASKSIDSIKND